MQASVAVQFGGHLGRVTYAGSAPGFAGLYQLNVVVPDGVVVTGAVDDSVLVNVIVNGNIIRPLGTLRLFTALER